MRPVCKVLLLSAVVTSLLVTAISALTLYLLADVATGILELLSQSLELEGAP